MWSLAINLPLMIGDRVPLNDNKWECFLLLLDILQFSMAKIATRGHAGVVEALVSTHHQAFVHCYPDASVPPKFHYAVHFPRQIIRFVTAPESAV